MLNERKLTKAELNKREDIVKDMKKNKRALVKKYGKDAEKVMYGRATNIAKKQAESMNQDKLREMIKDSLQNPKKADLNKDGKLSDYEKKRGAAIEKNMKKQDLKEFGSSDISAMLNSMHRALGNPKEFPGLSKIMDAAEDATDFYMDDFEEYSTDRDKLVMSNARAYARREFPEFMAAAAKFIEPVDEAIYINNPSTKKMRDAEMKADKFAGSDPKAGSIIKSRGFDWDKNTIKIDKLKKKRAQIMSDMEQEAELEGGPIADRYGDMLNKLDKAIAMLQGQGKGDEYMSKDEIERRAAMIKEMSGDKMEAAWELQEIMDQLYELSDRAKMIFRDNFPSEYSRLDAYGALDFGTSSNRYDVTFEKALENLDMEDDDEDMMQEDLDLGHQDNEPHMLKGDLYRIGKYAMELYQMVDGFEGKGEVDFPHWWQSKVIKAKDALVGAKHYLDFEIKEPQIDAMVDVAQDVEAIDEFDDKSMKAYGDAVKKVYGVKDKKDKKPVKKDVIDEAVGKFVVRPCSNPGTPFAVWQTSKDGENDKRIKGFKTKEDAKKFADEKNSVNEAKFYITRNLGRGQGKALVGGYDLKRDKKLPPKVFKSYKDAQKEVERLERGGSMGGQMTAYFVTDKDMNMLKPDGKKMFESLKEEAPGEADMVASDIQKAMNAVKGDEAKTYQLQKARTAMNKGDLDKAKKIADRIAKMLKKGITPINEKKYKSTATKSELDTAYKLGVKAFNRGSKRIPTLDKNLMGMLKGKEVTDTSSNDIMDSWIKGWDTANLKAPVGESVNEDTKKIANRIAKMLKK